MALFTILGISLLAETIGNKVQDIVEESHRASAEKAQINANMNEQIARMHESTARENAYLRAEIARMQEETNRANARVYADAHVESERLRTVGDIAKSFIRSNIIYRNNNNSSDIYQSSNNRWLPGSNNSNNFTLIEDSSQTSYNPEPRFCHVCGRELIRGASFCSGCGTPIRH